MGSFGSFCSLFFSHPSKNLPSIVPVLFVILLAGGPALAEPSENPELPAGVSNGSPLDIDDSPQDEPEKPAESFDDSVTVTATESGYAAFEASSVGKSDIPLLETPQSVTVINRQRLDDLESGGIQEVLNYAAGVRSDSFGLDSRSDGFSVRGADPDTYIDGLRQSFNFYTSTVRTDPYMLERVEVVRGPASTLYGQGSTAGTVNLVTKQPENAAVYHVDFQLGSFDRRQVRADLTGPLGASGQWLYRMVSVLRDADTQVDHVSDDRLLLAPSITWAPSDTSRWTFQLRRQEDRSGSTLQFLPWQGTVLPNPNGRLPVETFIGDPQNDRYDTDYVSFGWLLRHRLNETWTLHQNLRWSDNKVDYFSYYADAFVRPGNSFLDPDQRILGRFAFNSITEVRMLRADQRLEGVFETGSVSHHVLIGVDAIDFREDNASVTDFPDYIGGGVPSIDAYDPLPLPYSTLDPIPNPRSTQEHAGIYVQDHIRLGDRWSMLVGLRHDQVTTGLDGEPDEDSDATTGRLGVVYTAANGFAPYVSYSQSFTPVAGTDINNRRYDPLEGEQVELGLRWIPTDRAFHLSAAFYELQEENRLTLDPDNPLNQIQAGSTETSGFELEIAGRLGSLIQLSGHYNYLDNDEQLEQMPEHQVALWVRRDFSSRDYGRFSLALGTRYFSEFGYEATPEVPELTLFDARLAWQADRWSVALNVQNLEDEIYVSTCLPRGDCFYGAGRTAVLTTGTRF